jgi:hypothetical protein
MPVDIDLAMGCAGECKEKSLGSGLSPYLQFLFFQKNGPERVRPTQEANRYC